MMVALDEILMTRDSEFDFVVLCKGDAGPCKDFYRRYRAEGAHRLIDEGGDIQSAYEIGVTPFSYVLDRDRRVLVRGVANNWKQLDALLDQEGTLEIHHKSEEVASIAAS
jgi:hypothetical protein